MSMTQPEEGERWSVRHDGTTTGYLYAVSEEICDGDVRPHPHPVNAARWEWLTNRDLELRFIEETRVTDEERLSDDEIAEMRRKQRGKGEGSFAESSN